MFKGAFLFSLEVVIEVETGSRRGKSKMRINETKNQITKGISREQDRLKEKETVVMALAK